MPTATWTLTQEKLPPEGTRCEVITPGGDQRELVKGPGGLWFLPDRSMYVYFTPTHWKEIH